MIKKSFLMILCVVSMYAQKPKPTLVNLRTAIPSLCFEMRYATCNNITGQCVRNSQACYLCEEPARALRAAQGEFMSMGYCLKVWDAYQPHSEQHAIYTLIPDENLVTKPQEGDAHCRGYGIDVTLTKDGKEIGMGTDFDCITVNTKRSANTVSQEVRNNRELLRRVMEKHGFQADSDVWWHFRYPGWQDMPMLNIPLERLP